VRSSDFAPLKISFGSGEWCGNVYEELNFFPHKLSLQFFSYFEGESQQASLDSPAGGIAEDALFVLLRGLRGALLAPGEHRDFPFLPSPFTRRLDHAPTGWGTATIARRAARETVRVPA